MPTTFKRYAIVRGASSRSQAEAYLPANYTIVWEGLWTRYPTVVHPDAARDANVFVIEGRDDAGWTLDGYVIPRYGSGSMGVEEIDLSHPIMKLVPA